MKNAPLLTLMNLIVTVLVVGSLALPGTAHAQRNTTKAERVSESRPSDSYHSGRRTTASSNSERPSARASSRARSQPDIPFIMNVPRDPLRPSDRARYYGIGVIEVGLNAGSAHVMSDVGGKPGYDNWSASAFLQENVSYSAGLFARYKINEWFGLALGVDHARLSGGNTNGFEYNYEYIQTIINENGETKNIPVSLNETIYSFTNNIYELSWKMELHAPAFKRSGLGLYGFAGISGYYNKPEMFDGANQAIAIEESPERISPSPLSIALPVGGGITIVVANYVRVGFEIGYRYTANHGLDGAYVTDTKYDSFLYNTLRIGYVFPSKK